MWWGIFLVLGFTCAATINYIWFEDPARPSPMAQTLQSAD